MILILGNCAFKAEIQEWKVTRHVELLWRSRVRLFLIASINKKLDYVLMHQITGTFTV